MNKTQEELNESLIEAAFSEKTELAKKYFEKGANPKAMDNFGYTALMGAAMTGNLELLSILLPFSEVDAKDPQGRTAMKWAYSFDELNCVQTIKAFLLTEKEAKEIAKAIAFQGAKETTTTTKARRV